MIFKSEQIVNSPMAYLTSLPDDLKTKIRDAVLNIQSRDKAAFDKIYEGKQGPLVAIDHSAYLPIVELNAFVDSLRRSRS
jgi:phosphonate transport system substrate-binding protein